MNMAYEEPEIPPLICEWCKTEPETEPVRLFVTPDGDLCADCYYGVWMYGNSTDAGTKQRRREMKKKQAANEKLPIISGENETQMPAAFHFETQTPFGLEEDE